MFGFKTSVLKRTHLRTPILEFQWIRSQNAVVPLDRIVLEISEKKFQKKFPKKNLHPPPPPPAVVATPAVVSSGSPAPVVTVADVVLTVAPSGGIVRTHISMWDIAKRVRKIRLMVAMRNFWN